MAPKDKHPWTCRLSEQFILQTTQRAFSGLRNDNNEHRNVWEFILIQTNTKNYCNIFVNLAKDSLPENTVFLLENLGTLLNSFLLEFQHFGNKEVSSVFHAIPKSRAEEWYTRNYIQYI